jgi:hypothetical protein
MNNMGRILSTIAIILSSLLYPLLICAQCCSAGNPVGGDGSQDALKRKHLRAFVSFRQSNSRDYFHQSYKISEQYINRSLYDFTSLSLSYGLTNDLTIHSELGYFSRKLQEVNLPGGIEFIESSGLGDLALTLRYNILDRERFKSDRVMISMGTRLPIGAFNETLDGISIPISLQPSSGTSKINCSVFYAHKKPSSPFGWNVLSYNEWSNEINKDFLIYQYGMYSTLELSSLYSRSSGFLAILSLKMEYRARDTREDDISIESTGSKVAYIKPQVVFELLPELNMISLVEIPIFKYVNGYQLTRLYAFQIGIRKSFSI